MNEFDFMTHLMEGLREMDDINPNILDKKKVKLPKQGKMVEYTIYQIDAGSNFKIMGKAQALDGVDPYIAVLNTIKYKVEGIEDAEEFLRNNTTQHVNDLITEITEFENTEKSHLNLI